MTALRRYSCIFIEKYAVAPAPSRDYYGLTVTNNYVILTIWRISRGPFFNPVQEKLTLDEFLQDTGIQNDVSRIFGEDTLRLVLHTASGHREYLPNLPLNILKKIFLYLDITDVLRISQVSKKMSHVSRNDDVWKSLYQRSIGQIRKQPSLEDFRMAKSIGWRRVFMDKNSSKVTRKPSTKKVTRTTKPDERKKGTTERNTRRERSKTEVMPHKSEEMKLLGEKESQKYIVDLKRDMATVESKKVVFAVKQKLSGNVQEGSRDVGKPRKSGNVAEEVKKEKSLLKKTKSGRLSEDDKGDKNLVKQKKSSTISVPDSKKEESVDNQQKSDTKAVKSTPSFSRKRTHTAT